MSRRTFSSAARDVRLCDPANRQTTRQVRRCPPQDDHREHTSTAVRSSSSPFPELTPEPACRPHALCRPPSRSDATLPPTALAIGYIRPPSRPKSSAPTPPFGEHRSRFADRVVNDPHTSTPGHAPAIRVQPHRARSDGSELPPALCSRTECSSTSSAHAESRGNWQARTPTSRKYLRPTCAARPDIAGTPFLSARAGEFRAADDRAAYGVPASPPWESQRLGPKPVLGA